MHYPHEREERKQLLSALIEDAQSNQFGYVLTTFLTGIFICAAALIQSLLTKDVQEISSGIWVSIWFFCFLLISLLLFFYPVILPSKYKKRLWGIKRSFIIKTTLPYLISSFLIGAVLAVGPNSNYILTSLTWSMGYALSLLSLSPFNLPYLGRLATAILILVLSIAILSTRQIPVELEVAAHHWGNIIMIITLGIPCIAMSLWALLIKK